MKVILLCCLGGLIPWMLLPTIARGQTSQPSPTTQPTDELTVVRNFVDAMLKDGRDRYGPVHTPLFASFLKLDVNPPVQPEPGPIDDKTRARIPPLNLAGYRTGDRMWTCANVMHDENLYQAMYALTKITGDPTYAREADGILKWFFENCQSKQTNLLGWGEHLGYDLWAEKIGCSYFGTVTEKGPKPTHYPGIHEFYRPWALWPKSFEIAPDACERFARGLWENQVIWHDKAKISFSRHAYFAWPGGSGSAEFPRHGGFYIDTWSHAYAHKPDPKLLHAIERVTDYFLAAANPESGAIPAGSGEDVKLYLWPMNNVSLAVDVFDAATRVPDGPLATKMRSLCERIDAESVKIPHDLKNPDRGFVVMADVRTLQPGQPYMPIEEQQRRRFTPFTAHWKAGYGGAESHASAAMVFYQRFKQSGVAKHRQLVLETAQLYLDQSPGPKDIVYPAAMGEAIWLLLAAHELTGDAKYVDRADQVAKQSIAMFFAHSPIPRLLPNQPYYEAITSPDTLATALLKLWAVKAKSDISLDLVWTDR